MNSPLLALFALSLRQDSRSRSTFAARAGLAVFILIVMLSITAASRWQNVTAPGLTFFASVISVQAVCITLAGLGFFASAITEEKEEETLGLLRMTNLNPLSILLGKSTSRLCGVLLLVVAQLPFTLLAVTLGGVSWGQIAAAYCTLGAYVFFLANLALLGSVIAPRTGGAALFTAAMLLLFFFCGSLVEIVRAVSVDHGWLAVGKLEAAIGRFGEAANDATPVKRLVEILRTGFAGAPAGVQVWTDVTLGVICFATAWAAFARFADRASEGARHTAGPARRFFGLRFRRPPRPWKDALAWKDFYFLTGGTPAFVVRIALYGIVAATAIATTARGWRGGMSGPGLNALCSFAFTIELAVIASRIFRRELNDQTFSSLALLPLTMRQIAFRKARGSLLHLLPAAIALVATNFASVFSYAAGQQNVQMMIAASAISGWVSAAFLACLVAFLSLLMKRGALPVGFGIWYAISAILSVASTLLMFLGGTMLSGGNAVFAYPVAGIAVITIFYGVAVGLLQFRIFARLDDAAAES
jgi:hypothetical protein